MQTAAVQEGPSAAAQEPRLNQRLLMQKGKPSFFQPFPLYLLIYALHIPSLTIAGLPGISSAQSFLLFSCRGVCVLPRDGTAIQIIFLRCSVLLHFRSQKLSRFSQSLQEAFQPYPHGSSTPALFPPNLQ